MVAVVRKLTPKQERFCEEYLNDLNATQAVIRAGYSQKGARVAGARLLANVNIMRRIVSGKRERSERSKVNADWVLQRLAIEADADLADLYNNDGTVKPMREWPLIWRQGLVAGVDVTQIGDGIGVITKIKVSDRIKRIELIGKHVEVSAFSENRQLTIRKTLDDATDNELLRAYMKEINESDNMPVH